MDKGPFKFDSDTELMPIEYTIPTGGEGVSSEVRQDFGEPLPLPPSWGERVWVRGEQLEKTAIILAVFHGLSRK